MRVSVEWRAPVYLHNYDQYFHHNNEYNHDVIGYRRMLTVG